ncbi:MAG: hypothetical protein ACR2F2_13000 [Pyrinomonadaceae bacterium]
MGLGSIINSAVNKAVEIVKPVVDTVRNTVRTAERIAPTVSQFNSVAQNMTGRLLGNDPISDITRTAVRTAENLVAPIAERAARGVLDDIGSFFGGAFDRARDFLGNVGNRIVDTGRTLFNSTVEGIVGFGRSVFEGAGQFFTGIGQVLNPAPLLKVFQGDFSGAWNDFTNNAVNGFQNIGGGLVKATVQSVFDTAVVALNGTISAIQTLVGLEPPSRALNEREIAELRKVYGDSVDYSQIRIKEGHLGIANGLAPHTVGNTIYILDGWLNPNDPDYVANRNKLLFHETAHTWQYQNGGTDYIGESLWNQTIGTLTGGSRDAAYEFETPIKNGRSWAELNPEQQAHLLDQAYKNGLFDDPNARFVLADGTDITDYVRDAINQVRNGRGAP